LYGRGRRYLYKILATNGVSFGRYLSDKQLEGAAMEFASESSGKIAITEIAYKWGFNHLSSFNRAFKLKYGCSPSDFWRL